MTDDPDPRPGFKAWADGGGIAPEEAAVARALLAEIGDAPLDAPEPARDWRFLRRWDLEQRLGVLRILNELNVMDALKHERPADHDALLAELRGEAQD